MGIFDFLTKGPQLKRSDAANMALKIAINLLQKELEPKDIGVAGDKVLEFYFQRDHPDSSITSEQSVQILKYALFMFENHKDYLKVMFSRREAFRKRLEEDPYPYLPQYAEIKNSPDKYQSSFLSLFKL
jgi:hypothetical protein